MFQSEAHVLVIHIVSAGGDLCHIFVPNFVTCLRWSCSPIPRGQVIQDNFMKKIGIVGNPLDHRHANFYTWELLFRKVMGVGVHQDTIHLKIHLKIYNFWHF